MKKRFLLAFAILGAAVAMAFVLSEENEEVNDDSDVADRVGNSHHLTNAFAQAKRHVQQHREID